MTPADVIDFPAEDSPDVTLDELASAVEAHVPEDISSHLTPMRCSACSEGIQVTKHQLRRRAPHLYARVLFVCQNGHQGSVFFRAQFLGGV